MVGTVFFLNDRLFVGFSVKYLLDCRVIAYSFIIGFALYLFCLCLNYWKSFTSFAYCLWALSLYIVLWLYCSSFCTYKTFKKSFGYYHCSSYLCCSYQIPPWWHRVDSLWVFMLMFTWFHLLFGLLLMFVICLGIPFRI